MPIIAAVIVSAGALVGIFLGAAFASERISAQLEENRVLFEAQLKENRNLQQQQLDAEADRLRTQLDAAQKRLDLQLKEERVRQDRAELRDTLDVGAELLTNTANKLIDAEIAVEAAEQGDWSKSLDRETEGLTIANRLETFEALMFYWRRLLIRFKEDDSIPEAFRRATHAYNEGMTSLQIARDGKDQALLDAFRPSQNEFRKRHVEFLVEARKRVGVSDD